MSDWHFDFSTWRRRSSEEHLLYVERLLPRENGKVVSIWWTFLSGNSQVLYSVMNRARTAGWGGREADTGRS